MRLLVTGFMALDGGFESPERWSFAHCSEEIYSFKENERTTADATLLGRKTTKFSPRPGPREPATSPTA